MGKSRFEFNSGMLLLAGTCTVAGLAVPLGCGSTVAPAPVTTTQAAPTASQSSAPAPTAAPSVATPTREDTLRAMLGELAKPPFGTGAALAYTTSATPSDGKAKDATGEPKVITIGTLGRPNTDTAGDANAGDDAASDDAASNSAANDDTSDAIISSTPFSVQSVSKLHTAARVISLAHAGRLSLDDTVQEHLPKVSLVDTSGTQHAGLITLRHLLSHRAGLPHHPKDLDPAKHGTTWRDPKLYEKMTADWTIELVADPGEYRYSNLGYGLLAAIVERTEKCTFAECMATYLPKLGMTQATFDSTTLDNGAWGIVKRKSDDEVWPPKGYMSRYANPFGGLWTSMPDLARFGQTLITASRNKTHPLHIMVEPLSEKLGHGLGPVHRNRFGAQSLEHDGSGPGFLAWLIVVPKHDIVFAIATNGGGESRPQSQRFRQVVEAMLAELDPTGG